MQKSLIALSLLLSLPISSPSAHDYWSNGQPVPDWVKGSCCGPADAHHLTPDQVQEVDRAEALRLRPNINLGDKTGARYYIVDGYPYPIYKCNMTDPGCYVKQSMDGDYWIFYRDAGNICSPEGGCSASAASSVYCFFVPMEF